MALSLSPSDTEGYRRRTVLAGLGVGALSLLGRPASAGGIEGEYPMEVYVPSVAEFEDSYEGQFLTINEAGGDDLGAPEQLQGSCGDVPWPTDRTNVHVGQLSDRRSDQPVAVRVPVYMDEEDTNIVEDALFAISDARPCQEGFVRLNVEWVSTRSLVGKPAGPTVQEDDDGPDGGGGGGAGGTDGGSGGGFGPLVALAGVAAALLARLRRRDR